MNIINLDCYSSFPKYLVQFLDNFSFDFTYQDQDGLFWYEQIYNKLMLDGSDDSIRNRLIDLLVANKQKFYTYHVSILTDYEIADIKKNGMFISNEYTMVLKIENLYINNLISKEECDYLIAIIAVKTQNRFNLIYTYTKLSGLIEDNQTTMRFNQLWGGESTTWNLCQKKDEYSRRLARKLLTIGEPVIIKLVVDFEKTLMNTSYIDILTLIVIAYISKHHCYDMPVCTRLIHTVPYVPTVKDIIYFKETRGLENHKRDSTN